MCHRDMPFVAIILAALFSVAADKKSETAKEFAPSAAQIQQWVKQLGDESFKVREEATQNLIKAGEVAFDAVFKATKSGDAEVKQRALRIIKLIPEAKKKKKADRQRQAIEEIRKLHGKVYYDYQVLEHGEPIPEKMQKIPCTKKQRELLGIDYFAEVVVMDLKLTWVDDDSLQLLKEMSKIKVLFLNHTEVNDKGLKHLENLKNLEWLKLYHTKVTSAGLKHLVTLKELQKLDLGGTKVTDSGLIHLAGLSKLKLLWLKGTKVSAKGVAGLKKALPNCEIRWDGE